MIRNTLIALALSATATAAPGFDIESMSDADRAIFRSEIRDYLLENPEVLQEAIAVLEERQKAQAANKEQVMLETHRAEIFDDGYSYIGGNPDGDITIVEFLDYRCGYCKRAFPAVEKLIETDPNIKLIIKEFPILGADSMLASRYAIATKIALGDAAYKAVHDALMAHRGGINIAALQRIGDDLGLDQIAISNVIESAEVSDVIEQNRGLAQALEIGGTPSFIMDSIFVRGFIELDQMRAVVAELRAEKG
ncbi:MAG: DsbA family protein [Silicimonas sp.]|nr:DsbA family protein [Silicimonas sp.]